jgi:phosphonate transport system substrate-binding protein
MTLHAGFTISNFRNVSANDATAAFRVFAQTAGRKRGYQMDVDARIFDNMEACEAEIKKGTINLAILGAWDYTGMDIQQAMEPIFVPLEQGSIYWENLLLTRRGGGLTNLADLRSKDVMVLERNAGELSRAWLDSILLAQHLGTKETFFRSLEPVVKPTAAILPVFFGTKPACLANRTSLQIMSELNPQVGSNLVIMAFSEPYLETVICISKSGWASEHARQDLIQSIAEMNLEPGGRQILELFKLDRLLPFKDEYLNTVRKLRAASNRLGKQTLAAQLGGQTRSEP